MLKLSASLVFLMVAGSLLLYAGVKILVLSGWMHPDGFDFLLPLITAWVAACLIGSVWLMKRRRRDDAR